MIPVDCPFLTNGQDCGWALAVGHTPVGCHPGTRYPELHACKNEGYQFEMALRGRNAAIEDEYPSSPDMAEKLKKAYEIREA